MNIYNPKQQQQIQNNKDASPYYYVSGGYQNGAQTQNASPNGRIQNALSQTLALQAKRNSSKDQSPLNQTNSFRGTQAQGSKKNNFLFSNKYNGVGSSNPSSTKNGKQLQTSLNTSKVSQNQKRRKLVDVQNSTTGKIGVNNFRNPKYKSNNFYIDQDEIPMQQQQPDNNNFQRQLTLQTQNTPNNNNNNNNINLLGKMAKTNIMTQQQQQNHQINLQRQFSPKTNISKNNNNTNNVTTDNSINNSNINNSNNQNINLQQQQQLRKKIQPNHIRQKGQASEYMQNIQHIMDSLPHSKTNLDTSNNNILTSGIENSTNNNDQQQQYNNNNHINLQNNTENTPKPRPFKQNNLQFSQVQTTRNNNNNNNKNNFTEENDKSNQYYFVNGQINNNTTKNRDNYMKSYDFKSNLTHRNTSETNHAIINRPNHTGNTTIHVTNHNANTATSQNQSNNLPSFNAQGKSIPVKANLKIQTNIQQQQQTPNNITPLTTNNITNQQYTFQQQQFQQQQQQQSKNQQQQQNQQLQQANTTREINNQSRDKKNRKTFYIEDKKTDMKDLREGFKKFDVLIKNRSSRGQTTHENPHPNMSDKQKAQQYQQQQQKQQFLLQQQQIQQKLQLQQQQQQQITNRQPQQQQNNNNSNNENQSPQQTPINYELHQFFYQGNPNKNLDKQQSQNSNEQTTRAVSNMTQQNGSRASKDEGSEITLYKSNPEESVMQETDVENYNFGRVLGLGSYAIVRQAVHKPSGLKVAIKTYDKKKLSDPMKLKNVQREIKILSRLRHPNIIRLYQIIETDNQVNLVMELSSAMPLNDFMKTRRNKRVSEEDGRIIIRQLAEALKYCHRKCVVHRDIKLENVLVDQNKVVKLVDFGFAVVVPPGHSLNIFCGTPSYMAPEIINKKDYAFSVDVWAMAILNFKLVGGHFPFKGQSDKELYRRINSCRPEYQNFFSYEFKKFTSQIIRFSPLDRVSLDDLLQDDWILGKKSQDENGKNSESLIFDKVF